MPWPALLPAIERALAPFDARPHWGKWHRFDAERLAAVHPRLADARTLFERLDPDGVFSNAHLERLGVRVRGANLRRRPESAPGVVTETFQFCLDVLAPARLESKRTPI